MVVTRNLMKIFYSDISTQSDPLVVFVSLFGRVRVAMNRVVRSNSVNTPSHLDISFTHAHLTHVIPTSVGRGSFQFSARRILP